MHIPSRTVKSTAQPATFYQLSHPWQLKQKVAMQYSIVLLSSLCCCMPFIRAPNYVIQKHIWKSGRDAVVVCVQRKMLGMRLEPGGVMWYGVVFNPVQYLSE